MITPDQKLDVLAKAQALIFFQENWCKEPNATMQGKPCVPCHVDANAWSALGAIDKAFQDLELNYEDDSFIKPDFDAVVSELELDAGEALLAFNSNHTHKEVIGLFYCTMERIAESLNMNMYYPMFPEDMDQNAIDDGFVMFISKECDEAIDQGHKEQEERFEESLRRDREAWQFSRDDE